MRTSSAARFRGRRPVLVGVDGSVSAQGALAWATAEASYRHCPLHIVHAVTWPALGDPIDITGATTVGDGVVEAARWILDEAENHARHLAPGLMVKAELFVAGAAPTLLSQAEDAELVVVGSRGLGGFRGLLVGSVSATLAAHAPCPVIVVRPQRDGTAFPAYPTGRIVVGVDGSELSTAALRFAFKEAARRHVGVTAVHVTTPPRRHRSRSTPSLIGEQVEQQRFDESLDQLRVPGIDLQARIVPGHPAQVLIDESLGAELVVVGSHGGGGFAGMLLGSVSHAVLQHAHSPVAVVHVRRTAANGTTHRATRQLTGPRPLPELEELS
ncbi:MULTISPECIES: universal stress protein [unclassified Kribbella]|uniref:universal stress protein n=1 Tax=unclassified Kribbella TaxID=2644121 RepID=UPI0033DAC535